MTTPRIALATSSHHPDLVDDDVPVLNVLRERGIDAVAAVWDDPAVDWTSFDLVVLRSTWDYATRREEFLAWVDSVPQLLNPKGVIAWNTDKAYLRDLADAGVPTIPTIWLDPAQNLSKQQVHTRMPATGDFVIKPTVSRGAQDAGRYESGEATERGLAITHVVNLLKDGRHVMVQPYLTEVDTAGESTLIFIDGKFSHCVGKAAMLQGPFRPTAGLYRPEEITNREASESELEIAGRAIEQVEKVLDAAPGDGRLLYARVDLIPGNDGVPAVSEVEVTEPSLFLSFQPGAAETFAEAIIARLG